MAHQDKIFAEIEEVLQKLIANSEELVKLSSQVFSEQELKSLQSVQEKLLDKLTLLNQQNKDKLPKNDHSHQNKHIEQLLAKFESLNARFMDNLSSNHRIIHFRGKP